MQDKRKEGRKGEKEAESFLRKRGYKIIERNFTSPFGEIDLIAEEDGRIVFIEVKKRNSPLYGLSLEAVDKRKRERILKVALFYLKKAGKEKEGIRFDVVGIDGENIKLIKNAFGAED